MSHSLGLSTWVAATVMAAVINTASGSDATQSMQQYKTNVRSIFAAHCYRCHDAKTASGDLILDALDPDFINGKDAEHWFDVLNELNTGAMPPEDEPRMAIDDLREVVDWLTDGLKMAAAAKAGAARHVRRLNNAQYANTIKDLFGLTVDYSDLLLEDSSAKNGFTNNASALFTSTAHMEQYMAMARTIVDRAIPSEPPTIHHMKIRFGRGIGPANARTDAGKRAALSSGLGRYPVPGTHTEVTRFEARPPFKTHKLDPFYRIKGERKQAGEIVQLDSRQHTYYVTRYFAPDYKNPDGDYVRDDGLELQPIRHVRKTRQTLPDEPTLVVTLRDFPLRGRFALRVEAYRTEPANIIPYRDVDKRNRPTPATVTGADILITADQFETMRNMKLATESLVPVDPQASSHVEANVNSPDDGIYILHRWSEFGERDVRKRRGPDVPTISINDETVRNCFSDMKSQVAPECLVQLRKGGNTLQLDGVWQGIALKAVSLTRLDATDERAVQFAKRHKVVPTMRAFMGANAGEDVRFLVTVHDVLATKQKPKTYMFYGDLEEFPVPDQVKTLEKFETSLMSFGVENNQLVTPYGPSIIIKSIEFEGPLHDQWPTTAEQDIFLTGESYPDEAARAEAILQRFLTRSYRRPPTGNELLTVHTYWREKRPQSASFKQSIKEALVFALTTPQFLFMTNEPATGDSNELSEYQLASRLSYFLWNSMPDKQLMARAANRSLKDNVGDEAIRMLASDKAYRFSIAFAHQWLQMGNTDLVVWEEPLARYYRHEFAQETYRFFHEVLKSNSSVMNFVDSDFVIVNQNLASYYGMSGRLGAAFEKVPLDTATGRGGLLTHGGILLANSTGEKSHPIKRGVWLASRILASPPPDPPAGVPEIDELDPKFKRLSLIEQLEVHRNYDACRNCHQRIDPWGLPFESYSAGGRFLPQVKPIPSALPDRTTVTGMAELKKHLLSKKREDVARSVVTHFLSYAIGRELGFEDVASVESVLRKTRPSGFRLPDIIKAIVGSESFLSK